MSKITSLNLSIYFITNPKNKLSTKKIKLFFISPVNYPSKQLGNKSFVQP